VSKQLLINTKTASHKEVAAALARLDSDEFASFFHTLMEEFDEAEKEWIAEWERNGRGPWKPSADMQRCYNADVSKKPEYARAAEFFQEMGYYCRAPGARMKITWEEVRL